MVKQNENTGWKNLRNVLLVVAGIICLVYLFSSPSDNNEENIKPTVVEFCNNTIFLNYDEYGNEISGTHWVSFNDRERFEVVNNMSKLKIQKGIRYWWWIDSDEFYVEPIMFKADCIDEKDTIPNYIEFIHVYKNDYENHTSIKIYDYNQPNGNNLIKFIEGEVTEYDTMKTAYMEIRYYPSWDSFFMPLGGKMVLEYNRHISNVKCSGIPEVMIPYNYIFSDFNYRASAFDILKSIEDDSKYFYCKFTFVNPKNIDEINNSKFKVTFIPNNFWVSKTHELIITTDKSGDEDYTYTGLGLKELNGIFIID